MQKKRFSGVQSERGIGGDPRR